MRVISARTACVALALLFVLSSASSCFGLTQNKFTGGVASASIEFPQSGGSDSTTSIDLPRNITVNDAYVEMEGLRKTYDPASGFIDFTSPGGSVAFDGSMASAPPVGKPNAFETNNITVDAGLQRSDERRAAMKAQNAFPCHLFEFDMSEVGLSNFNFMWEGQSNMYSGSGAGNSAAAIYLYNCATGVWDKFQSYSVTGTTGTDYVLWANVSSNPDTYVDGRGFLCAMAVNPLPPTPQFTGDIQTDYVALWYNGTHMLFPRNLKLDVNADGSEEWQRPGQLRGKANFTGSKFVNALQSILDASGKDPVKIPIKFSSDRGGILLVSNLSIGYDLKNAAPTVNGTIPMLDMKEDTNATALTDLRSRFMDDGGAGSLEFSIVYEEDASKVHAALNADGHSLDLFTNTPNWYGNRQFRARATDAEGLFAEAQFTVRVLSVDDPPKLKAAGILVAYQGKEFEHTFTATDIDLVFDPDEELAFSTNSTYVALEPATGVGTLTAVNSQVGTHRFNVTVTDHYGLGDTRNFTLNIENANDPPVLEPVPDQTASEDAPFLLVLNVTDPDMDIGLDELVFEDNTPLFIIGRNGTINFTPSNKDVGEHAIKVSVHDLAGSKSWANFTITVINTNDPPKVDAVRDQTVEEDSYVSFRVVAADEDAGDVLTFIANTTLLKMNSTGWIKFSPLQKDVGVHPVTVTVTDIAGASTSVRFNITVVNVNDPPGDVRIVRPGNGTSFKQGEPITFEGNATDDDGDILTLTWYSGTEIIGTGASLTTKELRPGSHTVTLSASDGNVTMTSQPLGITVAKKQSQASKGLPGFELALVAAAVVAAVALLRKTRA
jgi:hypothetical protein